MSSEKMDPKENPKEVVREFVRDEIEEELEEKNRFDEERIRELVKDSVIEERDKLLEARRWENKKIKQLRLLNKSINVLLKLGILVLATYVVLNYEFVLSLFGL
ncbi:hypothetical protein C9439_02225 [archaeon SCG-AAA382B04]|nr:hypothetical protein C9439_02225 [archaeon SCG-AAA382B04]